jgi:hypothetical protein
MTLDLENKMTLTEQQVNTLLQHILHLQEQPSLSNPILNKREQDRKKQFQKTKPTETWGPEISGLTGERIKPIANATRGEYIAQVLYASKGTVSDNENNATRAILAIDNKKTFAETQRALQKLSGGKGIGQFIDSFFGDYDNVYVKYLETFSATKELIKYTAGSATQAVAERFTNRNHWKTEKRLRMMITHLQKIGAWASTISELQKTYDKIKKIAALENKIWKSSLSKQAQDFWNEYYHEILLVLEILSSFFGPWGWLISMGVGLLNSTLYATEGEYYQAGVSAIFSIMPGVFKLAGKAPQLVELMGKLGAKGMTKLAAKLSSKSPKFLPIEQRILKGLVGAKGLIKSAFNEAAKIQAKRAALRAALKMKGTESVAAGFGKLTAKDKIAIYLANGTVSLAELAITLKKYDMAVNFATEGIWDKIYVQYIQNTEIEQAGHKAIQEYWKQQNPGKPVK